VVSQQRQCNAQSAGDLLQITSGVGDCSMLEGGAAAARRRRSTFQCALLLMLPARSSLLSSSRLPRAHAMLPAASHPLQSTLYASHPLSHAHLTQRHARTHPCSPNDATATILPTDAVDKEYTITGCTAKAPQTVDVTISGGGSSATIPVNVGELP